MPTRRVTVVCAGVTVLLACTLPLAVKAQNSAPAVDLAMVARIRDEGLQRSRVMDIVSYITDVLGARLTTALAGTTNTCRCT